MFEYIKVLFDTLLPSTNFVVLILFGAVSAIVYFVKKNKDHKMATGGSEKSQGNGTGNDVALGDESAPTQCAVCQDEYENPRHLDPCLHIFCEKCILGVSNAQGGYFDCPICRTPTILPRDGVQGFKSSYIMNSIMDWHKAYRRKHGCSNCQHHPGEQLRFQCQECKDLICPECLTHDHNGHKVKSLTNIIDDEKNKMKAELKEKETNLGTRKRKLEEKKTEVENLRDSELEKIQGTKKQAEELIEKGKEIARAAKETEKKFKGEADKQIRDLTRQLSANTQEMATVRDVQARLQDMGLSNEEGEMTDLRERLDRVGNNGEIDVSQSIGHISVPNLEPVTQALDNIPQTFRVESVDGSVDDHNNTMNTDVGSERDETQMELGASPNVEQVFVTEQAYNFETDMSVKEIDFFDVETVVVVNNKRCLFQIFNGNETRTLDKSLSSIDVRNDTFIAYSQKDKKLYSLEGNAFTIKNIPNIERKNISAITRGQDDTIYLASQASNKVYKFTVGAREPQEFIKDDHLNFPAYICTNPDGHLIVSNSHGNNVTMFDHRTKQLMWTFKGKDETELGQLKQPKGVVCDDQGNIYIADHGHSRVTVIDKNGNFRCHLIEYLPYPIDVCVRHNKLAVVHLNEGGKAFEKHKITIYNVREQ